MGLNKSTYAKHLDHSVCNHHSYCCCGNPVKRCGRSELRQSQGSGEKWSDSGATQVIELTGISEWLDVSRADERETRSEGEMQVCTWSVEWLVVPVPNVGRTVIETGL